MSRSNISAFGIYPDAGTARDAMSAFKAAGFRETDISMLFPENVGSKDFAHERHTKAPEGAAAGGGVGAAIGAALGWVAASGSMAVPGLEPVAAAGPLLGTLSGMGAGLALGGITGALAGFSKPEYEAKRYMGRIRKGGVLCSIHCDDADWSSTAQKILRKTGAMEISTSHEARADFSETSKPLARHTESYKDAS